MTKNMIKVLVRPVNALSSAVSYIQSSVTGKAVIRGMPVSAGIELTNYCNLNCPECLSGSGKMSRYRGYMDPDLFVKIVTELKPYLYYLNLYFQGEPMLHPRFLSFIRKSKGINTIVSTNGHFLSEENAERIVISGLYRLIVSLDGMDQATYSVYRINGDFGKVKAGIKNMSDAIKRYHSPLRLEIQFLVNNNNEHQIPDARKFARRINARLKLKSMQIISNNDYDTWLPSHKQFRRYEKKGNEYIIKSTLENRCRRLWFNPVITWDGKVLPCCFDKNGEHIMGDLNEDTFRDIWNGPKYRSFRKSILTGRYMMEICRNCTSGLRGVKY
jgi:radical SAM protein with 4Fe4S-binding SPASM domain